MFIADNDKWTNFLKKQIKYAQQYTLKMLGCFNPTLSQIWTNPNVGLKCN